MTPSSLYDMCLIGTINNTENNFLRSIGKGASGILEFSQQLSSLEYITRTSTHLISPSTLGLVYDVATNISQIAKSLISVESELVDVDCEFNKDICSILAELSLEDQDVTKHSVSPVMRKGESARSCKHAPLHEGQRGNGKEGRRTIAEPYQWLITHLHNPYPTRQTKIELAKSSDISLKEMNDWFINVRKQIGWTSIRKRYFMGNAALTVDHAHRVFKEYEPDRPVSACIAQAFERMKNTAEHLY